MSDEDLGLDEIQGRDDGGGGGDGADRGGSGGDQATGGRGAEDGAIAPGTVLKDGDDLEIVVGGTDEGGQGGGAAADAGEDDGDGGAEGGEADAGESGGSEEDDSDLKGYGENVRRRIMRERRLARERRAEATAEREARIKAETAHLSLSKEHVKLGLEIVTDKIRAKTEELKKAKEDGKTDDEIKIEGELAQLRQREIDLGKAKDAVEAQERAGPRGVNVLVQQWKDTNRWYGHPKFAAETGYARQIDIEVANDGYRKDAPEYYLELTKRIRQRMPNLAARAKTFDLDVGGGGGQPRRPQEKRPPVSGASRTRAAPAASAAGGKRRVVLTPADLENMKNFGLDPKNREHLKEFARQKL